MGFSKQTGVLGD